MNIGTLEIQLLANVAKLQSDMDKSKAVVSDTMKQIESAVNMAKQAFVAFTGVAGIDALKGIVLGSVESIAKLHDLSIQAGITVEALSSLAAVGRATGTGADTITSASNKLSKALASANEDSKGAATALKALGLSFDEFQHMSPDERMQKVAEAMSQFQDGGQKSAAAMMLFGKTGAEILPFLKDLAEAGELHAKVTTKQAEAAHEFEVAMGRLKANGDAWKKSMALELLPTLNDMVELLLTIKTSSSDTGTVIGGFLTNVMQTLNYMIANTVYLFKTMGTEMGGWAAQLVAIAHLDFKGAFNIGQMVEEDAQKAYKEIEKLSTKLLGFTNSKAGAGRGGTNDTDPRSLGAIPDFHAQLTGLNGNPNGAPKDPQVNEGLQLLNSLKTKYEELTGTVSEYAKVERQVDAFKEPVSAARKKEILDLAALIEKEVQAAAAKKQLIAYDVEQANKAEDQRKIQADFVTAGNDARAAIIAQTAALGLNADELTRHNAMLQIDTLISKAMVGATVETRQELEKLAAVMKGGMTEALDALKAKQDALDGSWQVGAKNALDAYQKNVSNVAAFTQNAFTNAFKGMEDALVNFVTTGKLDFNSLVNSMIADLVRYQIQQSIMKPMTTAMGSGGGLLKLLGFANGGQPPVNVPSIVGESGPEIFVPNTPGTIVPNHALGGGSNVTVNVIEDSSKAGQQQTRQSSDGSSVVDVFVAQVKAAIASDITRGSGAIPSAMQTTYGMNRVAGAY